MPVTVQVPLDSELAESLREVADVKEQDLQEVVDDLVRQYLRRARREKIRQESEHFERMQAELKERYGGQHVAIHEGEVVDHDADALALAQRIRKRFGDTPVLIANVELEPFPEFRVRRPRLVGKK